MQRDTHRLAGDPFDVLVIGGGIYGAWIAYDAALRGLRVALVEKDDWAAATSSASSKLIHGGLRYLEYARLGLVRGGLDERARLLRLGPHRVRPLCFALPVYAGDRVGRFRLRLGLWLYDRLGGAVHPFGRHRWLARDELRRRVDLRPEGLEGGFLFGDCQTDDARLVLEIVHGAAQAGAVVANRAFAIELLADPDRRVAGARVEDRETGERFDVRAGVTVNCTGAWTAGLTGTLENTPAVATRLSKGVHLVLPALRTELALLIVTDEDGRVVFLLPWYGRTLVGTTDTDYRGDPADVRVERADVDYLLAQANRALGEGTWSASDVLASFAGLRTLPRTRDRASAAVTREFRLTEPAEGLIVPVGGKLTSAREDGARVVERALRRLDRPAVPCPTADRPFPWAPAGPFDAWAAPTRARGVAAGLDEETADGWTFRYGATTDRLLARIERSPELARRIVRAAPFCRAEIVHAVEDEMARGLEDVLRRRIPLMLLCRLDEQVVRDVAALVGDTLGWTAERREAEIEALMRKLEPPVPVHEAV